MRAIYFSLIALFFVGCSIGQNQTYCERHGADYSEAGLCENMMWIIQNSDEATQRAYQGGEKCGTR